ncbi:MAG: OmpA family protein [Proteobacteria bacterium]|nr:OmpA family protein [Pseudomonadota bacterium]
MVNHLAARALAGLLVAGLGLGLASAAHAATKCSNPDWAPVPMPDFTLSECSDKAFASVDVDLPDGSRTLKGRVMTFDYEHREGASAASANAVRAYQIQQAQKAGAKLLTANEGYNAVLLKKDAQGEAWYLYDHGSGNEDETGSYTLTTVLVGGMQQEVVAQVPKVSMDAVAGKACADPPWLVKQFPYFKLRDCTRRDYDAVSVDLPGGKKTLVGHFLDVNYELTDPGKNPTALYVRSNFVAAIQKIGGKLVSRPDDVYNAVLTQSTPQGQWWYLYEHGSGNENSTGSYSLTTLQVGGPPPVKCKIAVYGVQFDFNKATLKPESTPVLEQVLAIFKSDPNYRAEIGGHTDNIGAAAYNLKLSGARADAVKAWLVAHGIAAARITTHGYGDTVPLVPNSNDANRAQNRRVELKKQNCK